MTRAFSIFLAACLIPTLAASDDADDVKQAVLAFYQALNDGEAAKAASYVMRGAVEFPRNGGRRTSFLGNAEILQSRFDRGLKSELRIEDLEAEVFGDSAIASFYTTGPTTYADGTVLDDTFRVSIMLVRQNGTWTMVWAHISELRE